MCIRDSGHSLIEFSLGESAPWKSQSCSDSNGIISVKWIRFHISRRVRVVLTQMESYPLNGLGFIVIVNHANKELL